MRTVIAVDVKQQIKIRGGHRSYVSKLLESNGGQSQRRGANRNVEDLSKGETFGTTRLGQVYFRAQGGRSHQSQNRTVRKDQG